MIITGIILIVLGFITRMWLAKRAFYRRNAAGVEEFSSYTSAVFTSFFEGILGVLAMVMILVGAGLIVGSYFIIDK